MATPNTGAGPNASARGLSVAAQTVLSNDPENGERRSPQSGPLWRVSVEARLCCQGLIIVRLNHNEKVSSAFQKNGVTIKLDPHWKGFGGCDWQQQKIIFLLYCLFVFATFPARVFLHLLGM